MFLKKDDFFAWLDEYTRTKRNDLQRSQTAIPKRSEKIVLNLSVAPRQPVEINIPFKSVTFVSSLDSFGTIKYEGEISIILDSANTGNQKNAVTLKTYDTFNQDQTISKCFLTWKAQPGVFAELIFLEDSQLYSGSSKVQVTDIPNVTVLQGSNPWYSSITSSIILRIAPDILQTEAFDVLPGTTSQFTVPDRQYWAFNVSAHVPAGGLAGNFITLNGAKIAWPQEKGFYAWQWIHLNENDVIDIYADPVGSGIQGFFAKYMKG